MDKKRMKARHSEDKVRVR